MAYSDTVLEQAFQVLNEKLSETAARLSQLEKHIHYPHNETVEVTDRMQELAMKEAAAKAQAQAIISEAHPPPMRADTEAILALTKFAKRLLNPDDLGHAVTFEVRQLARRALGFEVKEYDL